MTVEQLVGRQSILQPPEHEEPSMKSSVETPYYKDVV